MNWIAPEVSRTDPPATGGERDMLEAWLDYHRQTLLRKCAGLDAEQLKLRSVEPSNLSLLGMVRHMSKVERVWFRMRFAGQPLDHLYWSESDPDADFDHVDGADAEHDVALLIREIELAREAVAGRSLDETFVHPRSGTVLNLRWLYLHVFEEYSRHNGHADLLRERIDGATGD